MSKQVRDSAKGKKPRQGPRVTPPPTGGPSAPTQPQWPRAHQAKK